MGRIVYRPLDNISVAADATQDLWSVLAATGSRIKLLGFELTSSATTATVIRLALHKISAQGTGGSSGGAELADEEMNTASTAVFRLQDTTTQGTSTGALVAYQWEQLGPIGHIYTPEMAPSSDLANGYSLQWLTATAATISGWVCWEEL
jgi:hypothetical protein